jgi:DNA primase
LIPDSFVQELLARVDVVDIVGQYVQLKKGGVNLLGLCPFHSEKSPSFTVSPSKQFYHCFGCGVHGSAIGFIMAHTGASFPDAVQSLASKVGMSVPQSLQSPVARKQAQERKIIQSSHERVLQTAQAYYVKQLKSNPEAIRYLKERGLTGEIAARFGIGWAPVDRQGLSAVFQRYEDDVLVEAGLVIQSEDGRRYDRFRERVMFPIRNVKGQIIGFGGRIIGKGEPKYLNSPETPLFAKGNELYGLWEGRQAIRSEGQVVVVEGYMDVVGLAQLNIAHAVATLGTATTPMHIQKLMRAADRIVFSFDGDKAGRKAAWRALQVCLPLLRDDISIRFLFLPAEHDPDSYVRAFGEAAFRACLNDSEPLSGFLLNELSSRHNLTEAEGRSACVHEAKPLLALVPENTLKVQLLNEFAQQVRLTPEELSKLFAQTGQNFGAALKSSPQGNAVSGRANVQSSQSPQSQQSPEYDGYPDLNEGIDESNYRLTRRPGFSKAGRGVVAPLAKRLFMLLITHPNLIDNMGDHQLEVLQAGEHLDLVIEFIVLVKASQGRHLGALIEAADPESDLHQVLSRLASEVISQADLPNPHIEWQDAMTRIELDNLKREQQVLIARGLSQPKDNENYQELSKRILSLINYSKRMNDSNLD